MFSLERIFLTRRFFGVDEKVATKRDAVVFLWKHQLVGKLEKYEERHCLFCNVGDFWRFLIFKKCCLLSFSLLVLLSSEGTKLLNTTALSW